MKVLALLALLTSASAIPTGKRLHSAKARSNSGPLYSPYWGGAVLTGSNFNYVEGTITVPKVSGAAGSASAAWVGIDGSDCQQALFQTGVTFRADGTYEAWYEWFPDVSHNFDDFPVKAGDEIKMIIDATSTTSGTASLENLTTGKKVSQTVAHSQAAICGTNAEWIVEKFATGGARVPLANFGQVDFTSTVAKGSQGTVTAGDADIYTLRDEQDKTVHTQCSVSESTASCKYI